VQTSSRYYAQASSGSHPEGCGLGNSGSFRAASVVRLDSMEGCLGRGCVSLNRRRDCDPGFGGSIARVLHCMRLRAGDADGPRVGAFRSDDGTQRSGRFGDGSSNRALIARHGAGGRIHGAELQLCGAGVVDARSSLLQCVRWSRAGRRATHGMRQNRNGRSGRRSNRPAPCVPRWPRERQAPNVRLRTLSQMHERAPHPSRRKA